MRNYKKLLKKESISRPLPDPEDHILGCLLLAVGQAFLTLVRILIGLGLAYGLEVLWGDSIAARSRISLKPATDQGERICHKSVESQADG